MNNINKSLAKVFYTPVQNPEKVECINVSNQEELEIINSFVRRIVNKKIKELSPSKPQFRENILADFIERNLERIDSESVQNLFKTLSNYMYGKAREPEKYWCLIATEEYIFIYHFKPEKAGSFEGNKIREFVKYLDDSTLLKLIFRLKSASLPSYFSKLQEEVGQIQRESPNVYVSFDKNDTKGFKKLIGKEPEYEFKGELRIRVKRSEKTDIVVETFLDDLENIRSSIMFDFEKKLATIKVENAPITEMVVNEKKYDSKTGLKRIEYEKLGIGGFIEEYLFYKQEEVKEKKEQAFINNKRIEKPESNFPGKEETIFILGERVEDCTTLIREVSDSIRNNLNVAFVELSRFSKDFERFEIGNFTLFAKFKGNEKIKRVEETFNQMINSVKENSTLEKTLHYIGLLSLCDFLKSGGFKEKIYEIGKKALIDYYKNMPARNMELREIDKLGIEFKAGIKKVKTDGEKKDVGFFDPSPKRFSEKLLDKFKRKKKDVVIFFVGINEDSRDFSPIPLDEIRNEFHESLKYHLIQNNVGVLLSETIPVEKERGILIIALQKRGR